MGSSNEAEFLKRVNNIAALFSLGREDVGEAMAIDTLEWIRNTTNNVGYQVAILLQLVVAYRTQLTISEREYYSEQLINLVINRYNEIIHDPAAVHLIDSFDLVLSGVSQQFAERWSDTVTNIMARRRVARASIEESPLEEVVSLDDPNIPLSLSTKLATTSRLLHSENNKITDVVPNPENLIGELRNELYATKEVSDNSRKILNGEINYLELLAGVKTSQPHLMLRGAVSLFNQPRRMSRSDKIIAAEVALRVSSRFPNITYPRSIEDNIPLSEFILEKIEIILGNSFLRFLAININNLQALVDTYLDVYLRNIPIDQKTIDILIFFQGCFYSRCVRFSKLHSSRDHAHLFVEEFAQLLKHAQMENQRIDDRCFLGATHEQSFNSKGTLPQLAIENGIEESKNLINLSEFQKYIYENEVLFVYYCANHKIHLVVIRKEFFKTTTLEISRAEIITKDARMKSNLDTLYLFEAADYSWIYNALLRPGLDLVGDAIIDSIVIVDAQLALPFHLAYIAQIDQFLIDKYIVSYCHSATTFYHSRSNSQNSAKIPRILLSGYDAGKDARNFLPLVEEELSMVQSCAIRNGYQSSVPIDTFVDVEGIAYEYSVFHFSGHAKGGSDEMEAWTLEYRDGPVKTSRLLKALHPDIMLCSLLGCSSAEHIESSLIGSNGLLGALVAWGIPNVIGFLWPVPDDVAARISIRFYEKWLRRQGSVRECLRNTLLEEDRTWGPALWGSAVCYGA